MQLVCLANSRKPGGRCVAGKSVSGGEWIRPISAREGGEISDAECRCACGGEAALLDVIEIPLLRAAPHGHQSENHLIASGRKWTRIGALRWEDLPPLADGIETLWVTGSSTIHGRNDRVPPDKIAECESSLALIRIREITFLVDRFGTRFGNERRSVRAAFRFNERSYNLKLTDPVLEANLLSRNNGEHDFRLDAFLCISLTEPHIDGYCYKLVASVITEKTANKAQQRNDKISCG